MPCQDQTEYLELVLDESECIRSFDLHKITCGKKVGDSMLAPYIEGLSVEQLMSSTVWDLVNEAEIRDPIEEFLLFKQFFSIRAALLVWTGQRMGSLDECFVLESMWMDDRNTTIAGQIAVHLISEEIKSCGSCKSCRTLPKKATQSGTEGVDA